MKSMAKVFMVLALVAVICLPGMARADITLLSGLGFYWSQPGSITFDRFDTYFTDSANFSNTVVSGSAATIGYSGSFAGDGWTGSYVSGTMSTASGPDVTTLAWNYNFLGSSLTAPVTFDINYFDNNVFQGHEHYTLTGFGGSNYTGYFDNHQYTPIPLPPTALLLGSGLLGLVGLRGLRFRKGKATA